jgi:hypothetical protein
MRENDMTVLHVQPRTCISQSGRVHLVNEVAAVVGMSPGAWTEGDVFFGVPLEWLVQAEPGDLPARG